MPGAAYGAAYGAGHPGNLLDRFLARLIDSLIVGIPTGIVVGILTFAADSWLLSGLVGIAPRLARGVQQGANTSALQLAFRLIVLFQAALLAPVIVWATPIADLLFGAEFSESADVLRWLAPFVFLSGLAPLVSLSEPALSRHLRILGDAGLVAAKRDGYYVLYRLESAAIDRLGAELRRFLAG